MRGQRGVPPHQRSRRIAVSFGLKHLVVRDGTELADRAVNRANQLGGRQRARIRRQRPREKLVECGVAGDIGIRRFAHVNAVARDEPVDQLRRQGATVAAASAPASWVSACLGSRYWGSTARRSDMGRW